MLAANYLGSTIEDVLALAVAGLASYVAVLNLPLRRADIKAKVSKVARNYVDTVTDTMRQVGACATQMGVRVYEAFLTCSRAACSSVLCLHFSVC